MAVRQVVGNPFENQIGTVSPTAQVVDTYERGVAERSTLGSLSDMLTRVAAKADPVLKAAEQRAAQREYQQGIQLYNETRKSIGEAVKSGVIEEGASPYLRKGYRVSQMNTLAMRYTSELETSLERQKLYTTNNPAKIEQFIEKFQDQFVKSNGLSEFAPAEVAEYFGTPANKGNELFRSAWKNKHVAWQREQNYLQFEAEVAETTVNLFRPGMSDEERAVAMTSFATWLEGRSDAASIDGMKNAQVLDTILKGVGLAVEQTGDTDILDVFKMTKFGTNAASKSLSVQATLLDIEARAVVLENKRAKEADDRYDQITQTARTNARAAALDFFNDPSTENEGRLDAMIFDLTGYQDDEANALALSLRSNMESFEAARLNGGQSKTPQSELRLDTLLRMATTYEQASRVIADFAEDGKLSANDVTSKLSLWSNSYDPANDAEFGLDFYKTSTPEGQAVAQLGRNIQGSTFDMDDQRFTRSIREQGKFRVAVRAGVAKFTENNGRAPLEHELDELLMNLIVTFQDRLMKEAVLEPLENNE